MKVVSICNQKGGVGKSTTAINLAVGLANQGNRVLLIDFDPQANTTSFFFNQIFDKGISDLLEDPKDVEQVIQKTDYDNLDLIPTSLELSVTERSLLVSTGANHNKLQRVLRNIQEPYDYCIVDCSPVLNLLITNTLFVSHEVIIPIKVDMFALQGYQITMSQIKAIMDDFDLNVKCKVLFTMVQRNNTDRDVIQQFREMVDGDVFKTQIRHQAKPVTQAGFEGNAVINDKSGVGQDYRDFVLDYLGHEVGTHDSAKEAN